MSNRCETCNGFGYTREQYDIKVECPECSVDWVMLDDGSIDTLEAVGYDVDCVVRAATFEEFIEYWGSIEAYRDR